MKHAYSLRKSVGIASILVALALPVAVFAFVPTTAYVVSIKTGANFDSMFITLSKALPYATVRYDLYVNGTVRRGGGVAADQLTSVTMSGFRSLFQAEGGNGTYTVGFQVCEHGVDRIDTDKNCSPRVYQAIDFKDQETAAVCSPYQCKDGTQVARCATDGTVMNYFAAPCLTHGGEVTDPYLTIKAVDFDNVSGDLRIHTCNTGVRTYRENEYGSISFDVSIDGKTDGFAYSEKDLEKGECAWLKFVGALSHFSGQGGIPGGTYNLSVALKNKPANHSPVRLSVSVVSDIPPSASQSFSDVLDQHPNADAIAYVKDQGIVSGYSDGTYRPDQIINRAEFTKIVIGYNFTNATGRGCDPNNFYFPDANKKSWYSAYLCLAAQHKIVGGYPDGTFHPDASINFVEASKIIATVDNFYVNGVRYDNTTSNGTVLGKPLPVGTDGTWYESYVRYLALQNAIPVSISSLDHPLTRGEMAEMIYRLNANVVNKLSQTYESLSVGQSDDRWTTINSKYFTLSFSVPPDADVNDSQNYIGVSRGAFYENEIGSNNAFFSIARFDQYHTRDDAIAYARKLLKNQKESMITVDGSQFLKIEGDDYGRYEGESAGKIVQIFFTQSVLLVQERPGNKTQNFDVLTTANRIISTMKFSSTAK
jgi:hypothetical protein